MILDLNPLPFKLALDIIQWCFDNNIDRAKAFVLVEQLNVPAHERSLGIEWTLDIPDSYVTWMMVRFS
jgi:hypothetical protein